MNKPERDTRNPDQSPASRAIGILVDMVLLALVVFIIWGSVVAIVKRAVGL